MIPQLRPYQVDLVERVRASFREHRRVLMQSPTGSGKTVLFAYITQKAAEKGNTVLIIAHRKEIIVQIGKALDAFGVPHGFVGAGMPRTDAMVQCAMVQTLVRRQIEPPDLIIIDECHHATSTSYKTVLAKYPGAKVLGVTATPERLDGKGLAPLFDDIVCGPQVSELMAMGHLCRATHYAPPVVADLTGMRDTAGDYNQGDAEAVMNTVKITGDAIEHYQRHLNGLPAIAFCTTIKHAKAVADQFTAAGYRAASVDGQMADHIRDDLIKSIGDGRLNVLTSCELISEGVDIPVVAGAIMLRPTKSLAMYLQQGGRVLRPKPDGSSAVILDHVGNGLAHGALDDDRVWALLPDERGEPPTITCETCYRVFSTGPKWREGKECIQRKPPKYELPIGCALEPPVVEGKPDRDPMEYIDDNLVQIGRTQIEVSTDNPAWARGIDIKRTTGRQWYKLLALARTEEQLREVQIARGYKRGWVWWMMQSRASR